MKVPMNVLVLGGTTEASALARGLAADGRFRAVLSLAGRTRAPVLPAVPGRRGGFGGAEGLAAYLREEAVDALVDATHPFAARMHGNAAQAARLAVVARVAVWRPGWAERQGDRWVRVPSMAAAAAALGVGRRRVLLTVGQQELAPFQSAPGHDYLIRSVEAPDEAALPPGARCIAARGPFTEAGETALLQAERIELLVTKDSGGQAVAAKLAAARRLGVVVVMVDRPPAPEPPCVPDAAGALAWLHQLAERGV